MNISKLTAGDKAPEEVNVLIEIPQGSSVKYEIDKDSGALFIDRFLYTSMSYPFNYGYVPQTLDGDGDGIDVLVLSSQVVQAGTVLPARPIGMLEMEDEEGMDTKVIAVPTKKIDPFFANIEDVSDLADAYKNKIKHFFDSYKQLEPGKWVKTKDFLGKDAAIEAIKKSMSK